VHISSARRTVVRQDQYGPEQGEKVVLLGAGGRSRRLPSSEKLASTVSVAAMQEDPTFNLRWIAVKRRKPNPWF
jgi:hypothetical protein